MVEMIWTIALILTVLVISFKYWREYSHRKKTVENLNQKDFPEHFQVFYASNHLPIDQVTEVWLDLANVLRVKPNLLNPEDRLEMYNKHNFLPFNVYDDLEIFLNNQLPNSNFGDGLKFDTVDSLMQFVLKNKVEAKL